MKGYKIDFSKNTITITKKFAKAAENLGSAEYDTMKELMKLGFKISTQTVKKAKGPRSWNYSQMEKYINACENSEESLQDFEALKRIGSYATVWKWFRNRFPNYNALPVMNKNHKIVQLSSGKEWLSAENAYGF